MLQVISDIPLVCHRSNASVTLLVCGNYGYYTEQAKITNFAS